LLATQDWRAGLYVGQLDGNVSVNGFVGGIANAGAGRNDLHNQYLGFYGTYAGNSGFYADAVLQLGRHRYTVTPASSPGSRPRRQPAGIAGTGTRLSAWRQRLSIEPSCR
jgi:outer membrane autotransporter protein